MEQFRPEFKKAVRNNQFEVTDQGELYLPRQKVLLGGRFGNEVLTSTGEVKYAYEETPNLVVDQGLDHVLNTVLVSGGDTIRSPWFVTVYKNNVAPANTWTSQNFDSQAAEVSQPTEVDEAVRPNYTVLTSSTQSVTNSAAKATFTVETSASFTANGAAILSTATFADNDVTAILFAASQFTSGRALSGGDQLLITYTISATSTIT